MNREVEVWVQWAGMNDAVRMGTVHVAVSGKQDVLSFEYEKSWLKSKQQILDPYLQYYSGKFFPRSGASDFSLLMDSAPGEWGQLLHKKNEQLLARKERRETKLLGAVDYLTRVFDYYRQGALRFRVQGEEEFATTDEQFFLPTLASLKELERASFICADSSSPEKELSPAIENLIHPGGALGGRRPKVNVIDDEWQMWMAKFPSAKDEYDAGGWEFVAHTLAGLAGVNTGTFTQRKLSGHHHTFLTQRFDRNLKGERIQYASAMTALGYTTEKDPTGRVSYLHLAEFLMRHGSDVNRDLEELWRRIVFSIAISNTDDHLRNHGFLLNDRGWELSPVFDLNPGSGNYLSLNIDENSSERNFELALSVAQFFRVPQDKARSIIAVTKVAVGQWRKVAGDAGIGKSEIESMEMSFRI